MSEPAIQAYLVAAGDFHDIDFARLELLKLLSEHENVRTTVASDYSDIEGINASDFSSLTPAISFLARPSRLR